MVCDHKIEIPICKHDVPSPQQAWMSCGMTQASGQNAEVGDAEEDKHKKVQV